MSTLDLAPRSTESRDARSRLEPFLILFRLTPRG